MLFSEVVAGIELDEQTHGSCEITGVEYDSRRVREGSLFVAMRGGTTDGNKFIRQAMDKGAGGVLTDSKESFSNALSRWPHLCIGLMEHGRRALATASANFFAHPEQKLKLTAVTGTNGKTTTTFLVEAMLRAAARKSVLVGTIEVHLAGEVRESPHTTPEARDLLALFTEGVQAGASEAVMEMSSHALDQERVWGMPVDVAIFTNLTQDHLDYHGTMERYFAAKQRLFAGVGTPPPRVAVVNAEDSYGHRLEKFALREGSVVATYGLEKGDWRAEQVVLRAGETSFVLKSPVGEIPLRTNLTGRVNVLNTLAAAAAAYARGVSLERIAAGVAELPFVPGRFQTVPNDRSITVAVDYAHTDDALLNLIRLARELAGKEHRVITLFGCGGDRDRTKRPKMGRAAGRGSDLVVLTSDNPRTEDPGIIIEQALRGVEETGTDCIVEADREQAIRRALATAKTGDIVLLAGKGHEKTQVLADRTIPFDDAEVAARVLKEMA